MGALLLLLRVLIGQGTRAEKLADTLLLLNLQRAVEEAAAALQAEHEAAHRRAAAKAAKRQRKKAAKQVQQIAAEGNTAGTADTTAFSSTAVQPNSSAASVALLNAAVASPPCDAPFLSQKTSQQGLAAPMVTSVSLTSHDSSQHQKQGVQHEARQTAAEPLTPTAAPVTTPAQVGTPELKEAHVALAPAVNDHDAEFQVSALGLLGGWRLDVGRV